MIARQDSSIKAAAIKEFKISLKLILLFIFIPPNVVTFVIPYVDVIITLVATICQALFKKKFEKV